MARYLWLIEQNCHPSKSRIHQPNKKALAESTIMKKTLLNDVLSFKVLWSGPLA